MTPTQKSHHVIILGAGVVGLQTALSLLSHNYNVKIVASSWPGTFSDPHYTSMFSGAQWRSNPALSDHQQITWDRATFVRWRDLISQNKYIPAEPPLGLELRQAEFYWDHAPSHPPSQEHWWSMDKPFLPTRPIDRHECLKRGFEAGVSYETVAINPAMYCAWLLWQCEIRGVQKRTLKFNDVCQVFERNPEADAVVNCAGLNSGALFGDDSCFPTKGQTVLVRGQARKIVTRRHVFENDSWEAIVIPRPGEDITMLGGCKLAGDWNTEPDDSITETILERCKSLAPELLDQGGSFEVLAVKVGLRPSRVGGPRLEIEELGDDRFVVHNYGHSSAGFEGSVGAAEVVLRLLADRLKRIQCRL